jgi:hypothetical protein
VPFINAADQNLRWFIQDVWSQFGADRTRPGAPLFPSERKCLDGSCSRAAANVFRRSLAEAAACHLPAWAGTVAVTEGEHPAKAAGSRMLALPITRAMCGAARKRAMGTDRRVLPRCGNLRASGPVRCWRG